MRTARHLHFISLTWHANSKEEEETLNQNKQKQKEKENILFELQVKSQTFCFLLKFAAA